MSVAPAAVASASVRAMPAGASGRGNARSSAQEPAKLAAATARGGLSHHVALTESMQPTLPTTSSVDPAVAASTTAIAAARDAMA
ncbi:MAG TPA: hypothetical protein VNL94_09610, partial [Candidatus Binatia bacterium]|nr:hypothetical protein [Candidatus Binatia bacterium]